MTWFVYADGSSTLWPLRPLGQKLPPGSVVSADKRWAELRDPDGKLLNTFMWVRS